LLFGVTGKLHWSVISKYRYLLLCGVHLDVHIVAQLVCAQVSGQRDESLLPKAALEQVASAMTQTLTTRHLVWSVSLQVSKTGSEQQAQVDGPRLTPPGSFCCTQRRDTSPTFRDKSPHVEKDL
jgi:hypothetical protein